MHGRSHSGMNTALQTCDSCHRLYNRSLGALTRWVASSVSDRARPNASSCPVDEMDTVPDSTWRRYGDGLSGTPTTNLLQIKDALSSGIMHLQSHSILRAEPRPCGPVETQPLRGSRVAILESERQLCLGSVCTYCKGFTT